MTDNRRLVVEKIAAWGTDGPNFEAYICVLLEFSVDHLRIWTVVSLYSKLVEACVSTWFNNSHAPLSEKWQQAPDFQKRIRVNMKQHFSIIWLPRTSIWTVWNEMKRWMHLFKSSSAHSDVSYELCLLEHAFCPVVRNTRERCTSHETHYTEPYLELFSSKLLPFGWWRLSGLLCVGVGLTNDQVGLVSVQNCLKQE